MNRLSSRRPSRLGVEALEDRALMSGGITFARGVVTITGTGEADTATVTYLPNTRSPFDDQIRVRLSHAGHSHEQVYNLTTGSTVGTIEPNVTRIVFGGQGGNDTFTNGSWVPSDANGGAGNDTLTGGSGRDTLTGGFGSDRLNGRDGTDLLKGNGTVIPPGGFGTLNASPDNDTLLGGDGSDELRGNGGADRLEGQDGNDLLFGEDGNDVLFGGDDNDLLRGGEGNDNLSGGAGADGLFGGRGNDTITGGAGADRILAWKHATGLLGDYDPDSVQGLGPADARVNFENGKDKTITIEGVETEYDAKAWTHEEIERMDVILALLQKEVGSTKLLKTELNLEVAFARYGGNARGFNFVGHITLTDGMFDNGETFLRGYVLHEIGHNWHTFNPHWGTFKALSGWTESLWNPNADLYDQAGDGSWWYHFESADMASTYSRNNPFDDFAESFAAYFMDQAGWDWSLYNDGGGAAAIPDKIELIDGWVESL